MIGWDRGGPTAEEVHGDAWAVRIRAQHEAAGAACPCGNGHDDRRKRVYTLLFDNREPETVEAYSPAEAVAARAGGRASRLPYQITDQTALAEWLAALRARTTKAG